MECKWNHQHVFLLGERDQVIVKELLASKNLKVELHDCDEHTKDDQTLFSYGKAKFALKDLLNPFCR